MNPTIETRIHEMYGELPARERRLADILLDMRDDLAVYSATELAARAGVSKATAARLFRRLGFADFAEMRQQARAERRPGSPLDELEEREQARGTLSAHLARDLANLTRTIETLRSDVVADATKALVGAERVWIIGFRNNYALALYARGLLTQVKDDVRLLPIAGYTVAEDMVAMQRGDAVLALGFRRRLPLMAGLLAQAGEVGARIILLTDPTASDCVPQAHVVLRCQSRGASLFDSYTAAVSVINLLCSGVAVALGPAARARLDRIETLHDAFGDFAN